MRIQLKLVHAALAVAICSFAADGAFAQDNGMSKVTRPAGYKPTQGDARSGEKLFSDTKLSTNDMSCASCHANNESFSESFSKPYPHKVAMADDDLGIKSIHLDEMIQACMIMPMAAKPLPWKSNELADLTAYVSELRKTFKPAP
jgi:cytochrome c